MGHDHAGVTLWDIKSVLWISFVFILEFELDVIIEFSTAFSAIGSYIDVLVGLLMQ